MAADSEPSTTIVLADDHAVVRQGLRFMLDAEPDLRVVGEAGDIAAAIGQLRDRRPAVLVLDLNMREGPTLEALPALHASSPSTSIVMLTMEDDASIARHALQSGAAGYVLKEKAGTELIQAIRLAACGRTYLTPELGARIASAAPGDLPAPTGLSDRENEILGLIGLGHTNPEIAERLGRSVRTIESHRANIHRKLDCSSRAALVRYALDHGLVA